MDDKNMEQQWREPDRNTRSVPPAIHLFVTNLFVQIRFLRILVGKQREV